MRADHGKAVAQGHHYARRHPGQAFGQDQMGRHGGAAAPVVGIVPMAAIEIAGVRRIRIDLGPGFRDQPRIGQFGETGQAQPDLAQPADRALPRRTIRDFGLHPRKRHARNPYLPSRSLSRRLTQSASRQSSSKATLQATRAVMPLGSRGGETSFTSAP